MHLIILAAGRGKRLPKKFRNGPKCLTKIMSKSILDYNIEFYNMFKKKFIITGFKSKKLKYFIKQNNFQEIKNKKFISTNMVYSLFLVSKFIKDDLIVCYGDIIFDKNIINILKGKKNLMPINSNWLKVWKNRMTNKEIINDAENLEIKGKYLQSIGGKIKTRLPKYQYMGIFKITKKSFNKLNLLFKKINNKNIDMTNFLNIAIKNKIIKFEIRKYNSYWFEIDNINDINSLSKIDNM